MKRIEWRLFGIYNFDYKSMVWVHQICYLCFCCLFNYSTDWRNKIAVVPTSHRCRFGWLIWAYRISNVANVYLENYRNYFIHTYNNSLEVRAFRFSCDLYSFSIYINYLWFWLNSLTLKRLGNFFSISNFISECCPTKVWYFHMKLVQ